MSKIIKFHNVNPLPLDPPVPASSLLPDWYKEQHSYIGGVKEPWYHSGTERLTPATIKRCVPVFDALTAGYLIKLPVDLHISDKDGQKMYQWAGADIVKFHSINQATHYPNTKGYNLDKLGENLPKINNPWVVETPKGYSTLFIPPSHRENIINILPGIVDTDTYKAPVGLPFGLKDVSFVGMIPAGTPIAQVIPFKRDNWEHSITENNYNTDAIGYELFKTFFDGYRNRFWFKKSFK
jgi:hypothetical protein